MITTMRDALALLRAGYVMVYEDAACTLQKDSSERGVDPRVFRDLLQRNYLRVSSMRTTYRLTETGL